MSALVFTARPGAALVCGCGGWHGEADMAECGYPVPGDAEHVKHARAMALALDGDVAFADVERPDTAQSAWLCPDGVWRGYDLVGDSTVVVLTFAEPGPYALPPGWDGPTPEGWRTADGATEAYRLRRLIRSERRGDPGRGRPHRGRDPAGAPVSATLLTRALALECLASQRLYAAGAAHSKALTAYTAERRTRASTTLSDVAVAYYRARHERDVARCVWFRASELVDRITGANELGVTAPWLSDEQIDDLVESRVEVTA